MTGGQIVFTLFLAIALCGGIFNIYGKRWAAKQRQSTIELISVNLRKRFPEFKNEFNFVTAEKMLEALFLKYKDIDILDDIDDKPISTYMRPYMSPEFMRFIVSDIVKERTLLATVEDAHKLGEGGARSWVDLEGKYHQTITKKDGPPPSYW